MFSITRNEAREIRAVCKRLLCGGRRSINPTLQLAADKQGRLVIRGMTLLGAVSYRCADQFTSSTFNIPLAALEVCEGKQNSPVEFQVTPDKKVVLSWEAAHIPRQHEVTQPACDDNFPPMPAAMRTNSGELLAALHQASQCSASGQSRYVLDHLQLDGARSQIAATDGHHLLVQTGYEFPWQGAVLIPASSVFNSPEFPSNQTVDIGCSEKWLTLCIGPWTIHLPINQEGRFPKTSDVLPRPDRITTRLQIAEDDAQFLAESLKSLPGQAEHDQPITLDLNGEVLVRAKAEDQSRPTELVLSRSTITGPPVRIHTNRQYLARAVRLGFRQIGLIDAKSSISCGNEQQQYVWMPLSPQSAIKSSPDALRIESSQHYVPISAKPVSNHSTLANQHETMNRTTEKSRRGQQPQHDLATNNSKLPAVAERHQEAASSSIGLSLSPINAALDLRSSLRDSLAKTNTMIAALRRQKRQSKLVATTLASLKQLQAAG